MTLANGQRAIKPSRLGVIRLGAFRLGYSPRDVDALGEKGVHVTYNDGHDALFGTNTGTVVPWGTGGTSHGVDEEV